MRIAKEGMEMLSTTLQKPSTNWTIQEGLASQIAPGLENRDTKVLAFVGVKEDPLLQTKFEILKSISYVIDSVLRNRSQDKWRALVEALTPDIPLSKNKLIEAAMFVDAQQTILETHDFVKAQDIAKTAHFSTRNPSSQPNRWKKAGQIFAVPYKGIDLYPTYALDWSQGAKPLPIVGEILRLFSDKDDWQKAFWFGSVNSYLKNKMPKELLKSNPQEVLRAAEIEATGVQHG
jgi:hypothetical protein